MVVKLLILLFFISSVVQAQIQCIDITKTSLETRVEDWNDVKVIVTPQLLFGKLIDVRHIERSELLGGHKMMAELLGGESAFFIGLNSGGHMYLVSNVYRYDGKFGFDNSTLREKTSVLDKGLVLRIEDKDGSIQDNIINYLKEIGAPRAINCNAGVCKILNESSQIKIARNMKQIILPSALIENIIVKGIKNKNGTDKKIQMFVIGNSQPEAILKASDRLAQRYYKALVPYAATAATASLGLIATLVNWFL